MSESFVWVVTDNGFPALPFIRRYHFIRWAKRNAGAVII